MSTPEDIHNQPTGGRHLDERQPVGESMDMAAAVGQLRGLVCGLGAGLLIVSLAFTAFVYKQNRNLSGTTAARHRQVLQLQQNEQSLDFLANELARYSVGKPELTALFTKHGIQVTPPVAASQPVPAHH